MAASTPDWDWLGHGIYFWQSGHQRALDWARERTDQPAVVGAVIQLSRCLDLFDVEHTEPLTCFTAALVNAGVSLPSKVGQRGADCFAIDRFCAAMADEGTPIDSVRALFHAGDPVFPGSCLRRESHIQIAVRSPAAILGFFNPTDRSAA